MKHFSLCCLTVILVLAVVLSGCGGSSGKGGSNGGNGGNGGNGDDGSEPTGTIYGTVTLSGTGTPIPEVTISTSPVTSMVLTDHEGKYSLKVPTPVPTTYTVMAAKEGFLPASKPQTVSAGGTVPVNFELMPEIAGGICGLIRAGGLPRSGIKVEARDVLSGDVSTTYTDTSGNYSIPLGPGTYLAEVSMDNYATLEFRFTISSAEEMVVKDLNMVEDLFHLQAYYKLNGDADDAHGEKDGTLSGPGGTNDRFDRGNNALFFDGRDDCVKLPAVFDAPGNAMTVAAWIKLN
ncbi:MAG: carboxypeptidase regulatory-like domain-containing protein, partial [Firmicutes bacterium]|nr:carboxypeptidase regulatory-like domain-containing protein [Bacillota bacterium]